MPSTEEREAQPVLEDPCPRCGSPVVLRYWKGRFFTKCQNPGCAFGYDADSRGNPAARCAVCGTGRMSTAEGVRTCADCGAREASGTAGRTEGPGAATGRAEAPVPSAGLGVCPKCRKGQLSVRSGVNGTFVSCSERCGLSYSSDAAGVPEGGLCRACQGPVRKTQNGSRVCAVCGTWQNDRKPAAPGPAASAPVTPGPAGRPPQPKAAHCPRCSQPLKAVFTKRQKWAYRCETCKAWYDA